jgi:mannose-1-phosphate guanylyltransferase
VEAFREKPPVGEIPGLVAAGAVRNTFVLVGRARTLVELIARYVPAWYDALLSGRTHGDLDDAYRRLPASNFSKEVLERAGDRLRVVPLGDVGWDDIGTPERLARVLSPHARVAPPQRRRLHPPARSGSIPAMASPMSNS